MIYFENQCASEVQFVKNNQNEHRKGNSHIIKWQRKEEQRMQSGLAVELCSQLCYGQAPEVWWSIR